ncbi:MAG: hypothetical protein ACTSRG_21895 [Candidatus Helarchaeota archaeon]
MSFTLKEVDFIFSKIRNEYRRIRLDNPNMDINSMKKMVMTKYPIKFLNNPRLFRYYINEIITPSYRDDPSFN